MKRSSLGDNILIFLGAVVAVAAVTIADNNGMPQKWHAAVVGTIVPFLVEVWLCRMRWTYWSFWAAFSICLAVHLAATWILFEYILLNVRTIPLLAWFPVVFIEVFVLFVVVQRLDDKFAGRMRQPSSPPE
jgi:hypothetical protein